MEEALSALKEAEDELHRLEHETQELLADESDSSQATMRSLRAIEAQVLLAMRTMEAALDDYEMEIEDSAIDDKDVPNARLDQAKHDYALRKTSLRAAKIKVAQRSQVAQQNDRTALLGGGTLNAEEMALRRRHRAKEEDPDGEKAAAQSISVLQKMKQEMAAETARSAATLQTFADSTQMLESTNAKQENVSRGTDKAGDLIGELARREREDRQMMGGALAVFLLVVAWVILKRLPFICQMLPCSLGGCSSGCKPTSPGPPLETPEVALTGDSSDVSGGGVDGVVEGAVSSGSEQVQADVELVASAAEVAREAALKQLKAMQQN